MKRADNSLRRLAVDNLRKRFVRDESRRGATCSYPLAKQRLEAESYLHVKAAVRPLAAAKAPSGDRVRSAKER